MKENTTPNINPTITLTPDNAAGLAWCEKLTGLSLEEIVNLLLTDELTCFRPDDDDEYVPNVFGCWQFTTRAGAERTLAWVKRHVCHGRKGKFPIFESDIREVAGNRFEIDAFLTSSTGKQERVC